MVPPLAPVAQWCARMMVLSIICSRSALPPPSANACSSRSHRPEAVQRRNWRCTEFQLPSSGGRSRHGAPVRAIQRMASRIRLWSRGGRPPDGPASTIKGSKHAHFSFVSKPRINAASKRRR